MIMLPLFSTLRQGPAAAAARLALLCAGAVVAACAPIAPAHLFDDHRPLQPDAYPQVLRTWTRSARLYQNLENKLFLTATFHAPQLRRAFAVRFPEIYGHGGKITQRELVTLSGSGEESHNFLVSMYTPDTHWNDLARSDSIWHLTLSSNSGVSVSAEEIVPIKADANLKAVYPFIGRFDHIYLVRFPLWDARHRLVLDSSSERMRLRAASALGTAELAWDLDIGPLPLPPRDAGAPAETPLEVPLEAPQSQPLRPL